MTDKSLVDRSSLEMEIVTDPDLERRMREQFKDVNFNEYLYY